MFELILKRMRERVRTRQYVMTLHAEEEMEVEEDLWFAMYAEKVVRVFAA